jgi:hypothetical protein
MGVSNGDEDGGGVDVDGSRGNSTSRQGARTETSIPQNWSSMVAGYRTFPGWTPIHLGFSRWRDFIGGRAMSEGGPGAYTTRWRGQRGERTTRWCGCLLALLRLCFGLCLVSRKIGTLGFVLSNSENISYVTFLKHKNSRKQELALCHLVNRLVPENA